MADLGAMIAGEVELDDLLATFADARRARARRRSRDAVADRRRDRRDLRSRVATLPELPELRVPAGAAAWSATSPRPASSSTSATRGSDPRWGGEQLAQQIGYRTTSMLTAPIVRRGQIRGVLQVLNKRGGAGSTRATRTSSSALAEQIGRALDYTTLRGDDARPRSDRCAAASTT